MKFSAVLQVPGNFHVATHSAKERPVDGGNMQHTIEYIAFGDDVPTVSSPAPLLPLLIIYHNIVKKLQNICR